MKGNSRLAPALPPDGQGSDRQGPLAADARGLYTSGAMDHPLEEPSR